MRAMEQIEEESGGCIKWRPRQWTQDRDFVHILKGDGCYSRVGRVSGGGGQILSLGKESLLIYLLLFSMYNFKGPGCVKKGIIVHEMLHAAGFWHEQSRPDRDDYVRVQWNNIEVR